MGDHFRGELGDAGVFVGGVYFHPRAGMQQPSEVGDFLLALWMTRIAQPPVDHGAAVLGAGGGHVEEAQLVGERFLCGRYSAFF